jgi:hypothetical protein
MFPDRGLSTYDDVRDSICLNKTPIRIRNGLRVKGLEAIKAQNLSRNREKQPNHDMLAHPTGGVSVL